MGRVKSYVVIVLLWPVLCCISTLGATQTVPTAGEVDLQALISSAPGEVDLPLDDMVMLHDHTEITLHADGRVERRRHQIIKILTEYAVDSYCDPRIQWDSQRQDLVVHTLKTVMNDGTVVERTSGMKAGHNLSQLTPDGMDLCPDYLHHQETVVTFLGIELGCVVEFDYSVIDREPRGHWLSGAEVMQSGFTTLTRTFTLRMPADAQIHWGTLNGEGPVMEYQLGERGQKAIAWTLTRVPGRRVVTDCAGAADFLPTFVYNVWLDKKQGRLGWYRALNDEINAAAEQTGAVLDDKVKELCENEGFEDAKFDKILDFVRTAVRPVHYAPLLRNEPARAAGRVYHTAYASPKDHAVLLLALCRRAGFKAWPVWTSDCNVQGDLGVESLLNRLLVAVMLDHGQFLVDPGQPLHRDLALSIPPGRLFMPPKTGRPVNIMPLRLTVQGALSIDKDRAITGDVTVRHAGPGNPFLTLRGPGGRRDAHLGAVAAQLAPGGKASSHEFHELARHQCCYSMKVSAPALETRPNGSIRLALLQPINMVRAALPSIAMRPPSKRSSPVTIDHPISIKSRITIELPESLEVLYLPQSVQMINDLGSYVLTWKQEDRRLTYDVTIDLGKGFIRPEEYPTLRELMVQFIDEAASLLVLR